MTLPLTNDFITKYIYDRISELELDQSKFELQIDRDVEYAAGSVRTCVYLTNLVTNIKACQVFFVRLDDLSKDAYFAYTDLNKLIDNVTEVSVDDALNIIARSYDSYKNKKENENMNTSNFNNYGVCAWSSEKTQEADQAYDILKTKIGEFDL